MEKQLSHLDILSILFFYSRNFHAYMLRLEPDFFPEPLDAFFEVVQSYYKKFDKVPPKSAVVNETNGYDEKTMGEVFDKVFGNHEQVKFFTHGYIVEKLDAFAKKNYLKRFLVNSYDEFENGNYDKILRDVRKLNESVIDNDLGSEYHDIEFVNERYKDEKLTSVLPSGFQQFDETFGGWHKKSLNIIAGPANSGKTMWLINLAKECMLNENRGGNKILYITLEIDKDQVARRMDCCLSGRTAKELWEMKDQLVNEKIALSRDALGNRLVIKEMPGYKTTPADIEACMRNLEVVSEGELKPNVVIVDYLGLLSPIYRTKNMGLYEKGLSIAVELRSLAQQYEVPFIVAAQTNRSSFGDRAGMDNISDSIGISQTADLLLTINRNEQLDQDNQVEIYLAKSRFCKNGSKFIFSADYETMRVADVVSNAGGENF